MKRNKCKVSAMSA